MNTPSPPPALPPGKLDELIQAMQMARDELLKASFLLREHLDETDVAGREQARRIAEALIEQSRNS